MRAEEQHKQEANFSVAETYLEKAAAGYELAVRILPPQKIHDTNFRGRPRWQEEIDSRHVKTEDMNYRYLTDLLEYTRKYADIIRHSPENAEDEITALNFLESVRKLQHQIYDAYIDEDYRVIPELKDELEKKQASYERHFWGDTPDAVSDIVEAAINRINREDPILPKIVMPQE
ncbi:hypothetical protein GF351_03360 [Candidatus Woesearchaeota archaeon]|nr:hypothetical protein [Candidatus Woesearchaeota archaeon]